jgi:hypothetical protein
MGDIITGWNLGISPCLLGAKPRANKMGLVYFEVPNNSNSAGYFLMLGEGKVVSV